MKSALTIIISLGFLGACSEKPKHEPEATTAGHMTNLYEAKTAEDFQAFKAIILNWARENGYKTVDGTGLKVSKTYSPGCVATVWTEGETPGIFQLTCANDFKGDQAAVMKAASEFSHEGSSLFNVTTKYYVVPK